MKKYILLFIVLNTSSSLFAQNTFWKDTELTFSFAFQNHDDRWFDYPERLKPSSKQDTPGSYIYSMGIKKPLLKKKGFQIQSGLSLSWERNTFHRPLVKEYLDPTASIYSNELAVIEKYNIFFLAIPIIIKQNFFSFKKNSFFIQLTTSPLFDFKRTVNRKYKGNWHFSFYGIELHPAVGFNAPNWGVELFYSIFQIKKKDKVRFYDNYYFNFSQKQLDEFWGNGFEDYNPTKVGVKISYRWKQ